MNQNDNHDQQDPAVDLIRQKVESVYEHEPSAKEETAEVIDTTRPQRSKHQEFMYRLSVSGKSLADIQTEWHNYYQALPEKEKHEVWQEFYRLHGRNPITNPKTELELAKPSETISSYEHKQPPQTVDQLKKRIVGRINERRQVTPKHHFQSLMFGLAMGSLAVLILLFSFFNERIIAPFITPSRKVSSTPIIIDPNSAAVGSQPEIVIPKINVEIPVDYNQTSIDETAVDQSLENGILHYPTTSNPGETGNSAFFGHSSNNIFNKGKYKFAFVLLRKLENGDLFYLTKDSKRYVYRVYDKEIVKPNDVSVLGPRDKPATATLITCDPPGTSLNRLIVVGEQISPDPASDSASHVQGSQPVPKQLPSNAPSLWQRLKHWLTS